jgi:pseudouridine-5'-phosphate glycosidase
MDISADLEELGQTPVMVVCAGAKSILDLGLTLEYLETKGVPVIGYGTDCLPAFYTRESDFGVDYRVDTPEELAKIFKASHEMGLKSGMLVTNPIPEEYAMPKEVIDAAIEQALKESVEQGIKGKETTPFLLARVSELTGGDSLDSNIQLVFNNAKVAALTAVELAKAFKVQNELGFKGGMLVCNPIPEEYAMPLDTITAAIDQAIAESVEKGIKGKETTPFLLARVAELTGGNSLASNIRLVYNNAKVAAQTAVHYCNM